jgi:hypothetical protein
MKKFMYILKEMLQLIRRNQVWFLAPILIALVILAFIVYSVGPAVVVTFIYAGF